MEKYIRYFAYGSNMCIVRIRKRVPSAERLDGYYSLKGHILKFDKPGKDGSGKCNAYPTEDNPASEVLGALFKIHPFEKSNLDREESGYSCKTVAVISSQDEDQNEIEAFTYIDDEDYTEKKLIPYSWYWCYVSVGAKETGLRKSYIEDNINYVERTEDPDRERHEENCAIICGKTSAKSSK